MARAFALVEAVEALSAEGYRVLTTEQVEDLNLLLGSYFGYLATDSRLVKRAAERLLDAHPWMPILGPEADAAEGRETL